MVRITRSKKVEAAGPLVTTGGAEQLSFNDLSIVLGNVSVDDPMTREIKGLKNAYKNATEKRRTKKTTAKQKANLDSLPDDGKNNTVMEAREVAQVEGHLAMVGRSTRRQAAQEVCLKTTRKDTHMNNVVEANQSQANSKMRDGPTGDVVLVAEMKNTESQIAAYPQPPEDSLVLQLERHTSERHKSLEDAEANGPAESITVAADSGEDSFLEQITCRSPAKPVLRIEDSVEALDKLEEAFEALDEVAFPERIITPEKTRKIQHKMTPAYTDPTKSVKPAPPTMRIKSTSKASIRRRASSLSKILDNKQTKSLQEQMKATANKATKRPVSMFLQKEPVKSKKPLTRPDFELPGEAIARKLKEQREARIAQRLSSVDHAHSVSTKSVSRKKSVKVPNKTASEFPAEAMSRKKDAQEARLKNPEEEERRRKSKFARNGVTTFVPRDTVASRARQNTAATTDTEKSKFNVGAHRPSIIELNQAYSSAPRSPGLASTSNRRSVILGSSMSGLAPRDLSTVDVQAQRQRAKEIYCRDSKYAEDWEREKKEREAAAKRARAEAAERGRLASREWAEKKLSKKLTTGDNGMSPGYKHGGQLGLKS